MIDHQQQIPLHHAAAMVAVAEHFSRVQNVVGNCGAAAAAAVVAAAAVQAQQNQYLPSTPAEAAAIANSQNNNATRTASSRNGGADSLVACRMADCIHSEVKRIVEHSRLVRQQAEILLVSPTDLQIGEVLGSGAFSEVHRVIHKSTNQKYAMKHLKAKLLSQPENFRLAASELAVEAHMLASFQHPNIISIHGWAQNGVASFTQGGHDSFFLLLDCLEETLDQRISNWQKQEVYRTALFEQQATYAIVSDLWTRLNSNNNNNNNTPMHSNHNSISNLNTIMSNNSFHSNHHAIVINDDSNPGNNSSNDSLAAQAQNAFAQQQEQARQERQAIFLEKLSIVAEIASALSYLHSIGVIFRDLKPNNIGFLNGRVKLFDFGLSRELPGATIDVTQPFCMSGKVGTLRYMAPEVAMHAPYNVASDVYSWAMVCYEVMTLQKPFSGWTRDMHSRLVCQQAMRPELTDDIPFCLQHLLHASWAQDQTLRPDMPTVYQSLRLFHENELMAQQATAQAQQQQQAQQQLAAALQQQIQQEQEQQMQQAAAAQLAAQAQAAQQAVVLAAAAQQVQQQQQMSNYGYCPSPPPNTSSLFHHQNYYNLDQQYHHSYVNDPFSAAAAAQAAASIVELPHDFGLQVAAAAAASQYQQHHHHQTNHNNHYHQRYNGLGRHPSSETFTRSTMSTSGVGSLNELFD